MLPEVIKNLLIINILMYIASLIFHPAMQEYLALYPFSSEQFRPYQLVTHMFMHGSPMHIFFNMFALYMFGRDIEWAMGPMKFLLFYFVTGLGAALLHQIANYAELQYALSKLTPEQIQNVYANGLTYLMDNKDFADTYMSYANLALNRPAVGASGAVFGVLAAFGMLYPNRMIMLLIPPIPMKAKYFVLIMGAAELYLGFSQHQSGVAHFAHVGGALFGFLMILYWRRKGEKF